MSMLLVHELHEARDRILLLRQRLAAASDSELTAYRPYLDEQIQLLSGALDQAAIPESYRVAVVGRFKVGKSSFVNKLADERLAGVDTNPETAAISVFRYDEKAHAEVEIISREEWHRLAADHAEDPKNPEVKRFDKFQTFNERPAKKDKDGKPVTRERIDLKVLADQWLEPGGKTFKINAKDWETKAGKKTFLAEIRKFTSSQEPLHYLVNKLTIYAPIPLLRDQIELIDTPGLDDTERFRVLLTEELVKDVDAILFLTLSGASYSQSDKDFIVRQLRRRQIKHLQLIVTKCDETYENARRDALSNDDDAPSYPQFCERETNRVKAETAATLNELLQSNQLSDEEGYYFIEQLDNVPVQLISTKYHDEGNIAMGGIDKVREGLYQILSASYRFEHSRSILKDRLEIVLSRLRKSYSERLNTLEREFDPAKVRAEIESIREVLSGKLQVFGDRSGEALGLLVRDQGAFFDTLPVHLDLIGMHAKEVLNELEKADLVKHWKTRRCGYWGYLTDLQAKIADRIFPKVEAILNTSRGHLDSFMSHAEAQLKVLQDEMIQIEKAHQLAGLGPIDLAGSQAPTFEALRQSFRSLIEAERDGIVTNLDDFVTSEVLGRLEKARGAVSSVWGSGTTWRQGTEVATFYANVRTLLSKALRDHLETRIRDFCAAILKTAESVVPRVREASDTLLKQRLDAIESSLQVAAEGKKGQVGAYLREMYSMVRDFAAAPETRVDRSADSAATQENSTPAITPPPAEPELQEQHYEIVEGAVGYTYERIFRPYIDTAAKIEIEDAHVRLPHQVDNLTRFCALAVRLGKVKEIRLKTGLQPGEMPDEADARLETLRRDLKSRNINFSWNRDPRLHDREIRFDNGWIVKIGRGLDIYTKPANWSSVTAADFSLRPCRQTKVDVFCLAQPQSCGTPAMPPKEYER